jgi:hypothetical protein
MPALSDAGQLRTVVTGLLGFAAAQEQELLASCPTAEDGSAARWAGVPLVAHNTEFKRPVIPTSPRYGQRLPI